MFFMQMSLIYTSHKSDTCEMLNYLWGKNMFVVILHVAAIFLYSVRYSQVRVAL